MLVGKRMTRNPLTVTEDTSVQEAEELMRKHKIPAPAGGQRGKTGGDCHRTRPSPGFAVCRHLA